MQKVIKPIKLLFDGFFTALIQGGSGYSSPHRRRHLSKTRMRAGVFDRRPLGVVARNFGRSSGQSCRDKVRRAQPEVMWWHGVSGGEISTFPGHVISQFRLSEELQILHLGINGCRYQSVCPSDTSR